MYIQSVIPDPVERELAKGLPESTQDDEFSEKCPFCDRWVEPKDFDEGLRMCIDCADADIEVQVKRIASSLTGHDRAILLRALLIICRSIGVEVPK